MLQKIEPIVVPTTVILPKCYSVFSRCFSNEIIVIVNVVVIIRYLIIIIIIIIITIIIIIIIMRRDAGLA